MLNIIKKNIHDAFSSVLMFSQLSIPFRRRYLRSNTDASIIMITKTPAVTPPAIAPTELMDVVSRIKNTTIMLIDHSTVNINFYYMYEALND